jgi:repressor LexA
VDALPSRQQDVLDFIRAYHEAHGTPPTMREVAEALGMKSRSTAHSHMLALERKGYLDARLVRGQTAYFPDGVPD